MKRITSLKIEKLFGTFDYEIDFEKTDGFTILTAPNGFGKSTVLKIIRAAAVGNFCYFAGLVFDRIEMKFKGTMGDEWRPRMGPGSEPLSDEEAARPKETILFIEKTARVVEESEEEASSSENSDEETFQPYVCRICCDDFENFFTDEDIDRSVSEVVGSIQTLEPMYQYMSNGSCRLWKDKKDGEVFDMSGVFRRYSLHFRRIFPWLVALVRRLNFEVNYISTNRLYNEEIERSVSGFAGRVRGRQIEEGQDLGLNPHLLKIFSISDDIRAAHNRCMRAQLQIARNLESNFVDRVVETLNQKNRPSAEETRKKISSKMTSIARLEKSCNEFGIITSANKKKSKNPETDDDSALIVFSMYLDDVKAKMDVFEPLIKKLKIFSESLKELLDLKTVTINLSDWESILGIKNSRSGAAIPLDALSSGEQHLIVLLGRLLFDANNSEALVMMDEPEISFHPSWQEEFSEILFKIQNESRDAKNARPKRQFIVATHSPAFIGDHWDKTVELAKMVK